MREGEGGAETPPGAFHSFPFHPQPPGGTADPTQQAREQIGKCEKKTKRQRALLLGRMGEEPLLASSVAPSSCSETFHSILETGCQSL